MPRARKVCYEPTELFGAARQDSARDQELRRPGSDCGSCSGASRTPPNLCCYWVRGEFNKPLAPSSVHVCCGLTPTRRVCALPRSGLGTAERLGYLGGTAMSFLRLSAVVFPTGLPLIQGLGDIDNRLNVVTPAQFAALSSVLPIV